MKQKLPVTILTGFLGSGKTTLINRLLKERPGTKFGLIVNEFGDAALESQLLEIKKQPLLELPSGCLCCVGQTDLAQALKSLVTKGPHLDHILVEASGLSSPGPLLGVLTQDGDYSLGGVFCLVDATGFLSHEMDFPTLRRQLAFADAVILTKTDLAVESVALAVIQRLGEIKPGVKILDAAHRLPWSVLFETAETPSEVVAAERPTVRKRFFQGGTHHGVQVLEYTSEQPLDPDRLGEVFAALEPGILRAKGIANLAVSSGDRYKYIVQFTGTQKQLYSRTWNRGEAHKTSLVFLGSDFDSQALYSRLEQCQTEKRP